MIGGIGEYVKPVVDQRTVWYSRQDHLLSRAPPSEIPWTEASLALTAFDKIPRPVHSNVNMYSRAMVFIVTR